LDWVAQLFQAIDRMDSDGLALFLANDATFQFGNAQPVKGKQNVRDAVAAFFSSIKGISHRLLGTWQVDDVVFVQGEATYTRKDDKIVRVPFFNLFKMNGPLVSQYVIYVDTSPLYA
jgi:ketosteroid isomerase-like protein